MLLDPIHAISSLNFYRRAAAQAWWRSALYLVYLSFLVSLAFTVTLKIHAGPSIDSTFEWLKKSAPPLTFVNGKLTSSLTQPLFLQHPDLKQIAVVIDTNRTEAVTLQALQDAKAHAFLTANALYLEQQFPGQPAKLIVYNFSAAADPKPVLIDAAFFENARQIFDRILYPAVFASGWLFVILWKAGATLMFALVGLLLNALAEGGVAFPALAAVALYAQTLPTVLQSLTMLFGVGIPLWPVVSLVATGAYIWLAIGKLREPVPAEIPPAA